MRKITTIVLALACLASLAQAQPSAQLLPAAAGDLQASELVRIPVHKGLLPGVSRDAVDFAYALDAGAQLDAAPQPFIARSREYFVDVSAADLRQGVEIFTTAPGALVRINPAAKAQLSGDAASLAIDPQSLVVQDAAGLRFSASEGLDRLVDAAQLKATGVPFAEGTTAFRLAQGVGVGAIRIAAPSLKAEGSGYTVHVFDQASPIALELGASRVDFLHGDLLTVRAAFSGASVRTAVVEGFVTSPGGRAWPVEMRREADGFVGQLTLDALAAPGDGLWEVHLAARGSANGLDVVRSARTSFAAHLPTAALDGGVAMRRTRGGLELDLGVSVGTPGRFEVRGVLYGTDLRTGALRPVSIGHSANWLDADGRLTLRFDIGGVSAPFELRDLRLLDQGRMGVLHRQQRAIEITR